MAHPALESDGPILQRQIAESIKNLLKYNILGVGPRNLPFSQKASLMTLKFGVGEQMDQKLMLEKYDNLRTVVGLREELGSFCNEISMNQVSVVGRILNNGSSLLGVCNLDSKQVKA